MKLSALALLLCLSPAALAAEEDAPASAITPLFETDAEELQLLQPTPLALPDIPDFETPPASLPFNAENSTETGTTIPPITVEPQLPLDTSETIELPAPPTILSPPEIKFSEESHDLLYRHHALLYQEGPKGLEILMRGGQDGFGLTTLPFTTLLKGDSDAAAMWLEPQFLWTFVNGPAGVDLPPQFYQFALGINAVAANWQGFKLHIHISPTYSTDSHNKSGDAFRLIAGGMVTMDLSQQWTLVAGATYLDRPDVPVIPAAGLLWRPQDAVEIDLVVPKPKVAIRISGDEESEHWMYVKGDVGGGSWAYKRESGLDERVGYFDMRILFGIDTRLPESDSQFEIGYVFQRELDFDAAGTTLEPPNSVVFRFTSSY